MDDVALVDVFSEKRRDFVAVMACKIRCPECGARYADMVWCEVCLGEPFLECACGEQYSLTANRHLYENVGR